MSDSPAHVTEQALRALDEEHWDQALALAGAVRALGGPPEAQLALCIEELAGFGQGLPKDFRDALRARLAGRPGPSLGAFALRNPGEATLAVAKLRSAPALWQRFGAELEAGHDESKRAGASPGLVVGGAAGALTVGVIALRLVLMGVRASSADAPDSANGLIAAAMNERRSETEGRARQAAQAPPKVVGLHRPPKGAPVPVFWKLAESDHPKIVWAEVDTEFVLLRTRVGDFEPQAQQFVDGEGAPSAESAPGARRLVGFLLPAGLTAGQICHDSGASCAAELPIQQR